MMERIIRAGVFGVGSLGEHHARIYGQLPGVELKGIYDIDKRRAQKIARKYRTRAYDSMEALAADIEAASVVVPTDLHREIAGALLEQGIHLLVEKPLAVTTSEAEELVDISRKQGVILQVGHIERFNPVLAFLENSEHDVRFIEAHRLAPYPPQRAGAPPRGTEVSVILDLMIHDIEIILHLMRSKVRELHAVGIPVLSPTEDIANVRLTFQNGGVANVTASRISPEKMRKIRIFRTDAYISLDYMTQEGEVYRQAGDSIVRDRVPVEKGEPLARELDAFTKCVATQGAPKVSGRQAADALSLAIDIIHHIQAGGS